MEKIEETIDIGMFNFWKCKTCKCTNEVYDTNEKYLYCSCGERKRILDDEIIDYYGLGY